MRKIGKTLVGAALVSSLVAAGGLVSVQPASAHSGAWSKTRSNCRYTGGVTNTHGYAWTQRETGSCAGHPWLLLNWEEDGWIVTREVHKAQFVSSSPPAGRSFRTVCHKSQENESYGCSHGS